LLPLALLPRERLATRIRLREFLSDRMRPQNFFGKLIQLSNLPWSRWSPFIQGWIRRQRTGCVPCAFPRSQRLVLVPLRVFYETFWFFCEAKEGRRELAFFLDKLRPGDVLYDIGAFHGAYGAAAKAVHGDAIQVHLFEPLPENLGRIDEISKLNRFQTFTLVDKAVGSGAAILGTVGVHDSMLRPGASDQANTLTEFRSTSVDAYSGDSKISPSVMKIDVEGFEFDLLEGARETLRNHHPRLWIEVHPAFLSAQGKRWEDLVEWLKTAGYRVTFFDDFNEPTKEMAFHIWCEP
jgi:FkbM family methyltransferase